MIIRKVHTFSLFSKTNMLAITSRDRDVKSSTKSLTTITVMIIYSAQLEKFISVCFLRAKHKGNPFSFSENVLKDLRVIFWIPNTR